MLKGKHCLQKNFVKSQRKEYKKKFRGIEIYFMTTAQMSRSKNFLLHLELGQKPNILFLQSV